MTTTNQIASLYPSNEAVFCKPESSEWTPETLLAHNFHVSANVSRKRKVVCWIRFWRTEQMAQRRVNSENKGKEGEELADWLWQKRRASNYSDNFTCQARGAVHQEPTCQRHNTPSPRFSGRLQKQELSISLQRGELGGKQRLGMLNEQQLSN